MSTAAFQVGMHGDGVLAIGGTLTFDTAHAALLALRESLRDASVRDLDLAGIERSDSAGLSCVLAVLAGVRSSGRVLRVRNIPVGMHALASVCEVEPLLTPA